MKTNSKEVSERFVEAYYRLYALRKVANKKDYCNHIGMFATNFRLVENGKRACTVDQICNLVSEFNVNPNWILLGIGEFRF